MTQAAGAPGTQSGDGLLALAMGGVQLGGTAGPRLGHRRAGEGYRDDRRVAGEVVSIGDGVGLRFLLPDPSADFILIEPAAIPGSYIVRSLAYCGRDVPDLRRRIVHARECAGAAAAGGIRFGSSHGRPALEVDVRGLSGEGDNAGVELVLLRDADSAAAALASAELREEVLRSRDAGQAAASRLARSLAALADRIDGIALAVDGLPTMAAEQRAQGLRLSTLEQQLGALSVGLGLTAREQSVEALAAALERASAAQSATQAQLSVYASASASSAFAAEQAARHLDSLQHVLPGVDARVAELQSQAAQVRDQLARLINAVENVFWRRWLRRLRGGNR